MNPLQKVFTEYTAGDENDQLRVGCVIEGGRCDAGMTGIHGFMAIGMV